MSADIATITEPELACLENIVRSGLQPFMAVGLALIEIRETRAYRLRDFQTFEAYTKATFGFSGRHGRRMMAAARTVHQVTGVTGQAPGNESVARVLAPVADDAPLLDTVRRRLEARGLTLGNAPASVIAGLLPGESTRTRPTRTKPEPRSADEYVEPREPGADVCPTCGRRPLRYFYRELEGGWLCAHCNHRVRLTVARA